MKIIKLELNEDYYGESSNFSLNYQNFVIALFSKCVVKYFSNDKQYRYSSSNLTFKTLLLNNAKVQKNVPKTTDENFY